MPRYVVLRKAPDQLARDPLAQSPAAVVFRNPHATQLVRPLIRLDAAARDDAFALSNRDELVGLEALGIEPLAL